MSLSRAERNAAIAGDYDEASYLGFTRVEDVRPAVDVRPHMFPQQRAVMDSDARMRALRCGRRGGKSAGIIGWAIEGALETPNSLCPIFGLTAKSVRLYAWRETKAWAHRLGFPAEWLSDHTMTLRLPNGSQVICTGTDDMRTIESWRGVATKRVVIDECGAQQDGLLRYLVRDILRATMIDQGGQMALTGTPGLTLAGFWFELTGPASTSSVPCFHWTLLDNPHIPNGAEELAAIREENGWDESNPTYVREYLGEWAEDEGALVYPYNDERNGLDKLPTQNSHGRPLGDAAGWRYVVAVDPAGVGTTGLSVLAAHPDLTGVFVVESSAHAGIGIAELAQLVREKQKTYHARLVMDVGGLGSTHAQEFTRVYAIGVEPAEKRDKPSSIRFTRDHFISGRLKVLRGACNDALRQEAAVLGWDAKRLQHHPDQADHVMDTVLYGVRYLRAYTRQEREPDVVLSAVEEHAKRREQFFADVERRRRGDGRHEWAR